MKRVSWIWIAPAIAMAALVVAPQAQAEPKGKSRISASRTTTIRTPNRAAQRSRSVSVAPRRGAAKGILGQALRQELGEHLDDRHRRRNNFFDYLEDRQEDRKDAYRDALIADTIVQVVGIIANSAQPRTVAPPPRVVAPAPGHYEIQRVKIRDGYWETQQVWVPDYQDPATGGIVEGHYETHRRWVPEVYEERKVWVPHRTPLP